MSILKTDQVQRVDGQPILKTTGSIIQTVVLKNDTKTTLKLYKILKEKRLLLEKFLNKKGN